MEVELAWAAGFYDGEGSTSYLKKGTWVGPRMSITQKGRDCLERFQAAVKGGKIYKINTRAGQWVWTCQKRTDVDRILSALWPYLSVPKKQQAMNLAITFTNKAEEGSIWVLVQN